MPLPPRLFPGDEELGKKDDDHKPGVKNSFGIPWQQWRPFHGPHRRNTKRVVLGLVVLICLCYLFKSMPTTDLENSRLPPAVPLASPPASQGSTPKPEKEETMKASPHYFNGPIKFYQLASTLRAFSKTKSAELNRNVVRALEPLHTSLLIIASSYLPLPV